VHLSDAVNFAHDKTGFKHRILDQNSVWKETCSTWSYVADKLVVKALLWICRDKSLLLQKRDVTGYAYW